MGRQDVDGLKGDESNTYNGHDLPVVPADRDDLRARSAARLRTGPPRDQRRADGRLRAELRRRARRRARPASIMGYHTGATVPVYDALARDFAIGHRWFASHPGPTFCNRFYELTGRLNLDPRGFWEFDNSSPMRPVFTPTIFDYLTRPSIPIRRSRSPGATSSTATASCASSRRYTFDHTNIVDCRRSRESASSPARSAGTLPNVSFIDPHFVELPARQQLRRAPGRRRGRPGLRPAGRRGRRRGPGLEQDAAAHRLRRARRLLRPRAAAAGRARSRPSSRSRRSACASRRS